MCQTKPLVVTGGADRTLRLWNWKAKSLLLSKKFQSDIWAAAVHPSSHFVAAAFSDKLRSFFLSVFLCLRNAFCLVGAEGEVGGGRASVSRLLLVLSSELRVSAQFSIRRSAALAFARGGHLLAAANGSAVEVFCTFSQNHLLSLKAHSGNVRALRFSSSDSSLATAGDDGAVYEFALDRVSIRKRQREGEGFRETERPLLLGWLLCRRGRACKTGFVKGRSFVTSVQLKQEDSHPLPCLLEG